MFNKVHLAVGSLFLVLVVSCASDNVAGGTIDPNSLALYSSSSADVEDVLSSSANTSSPNVMSSSSSSGTKKGVDASSSSQSQDVKLSSDAVDGPLFPKAENFAIQCVADSDEETPVAYKHVEGGSVQVSLQNVYFEVPCDEGKRAAFIESVNSTGPALDLKKDTLFVDFSRGEEIQFGCGCAAKASFSLDTLYSDFKYTVFDRRDTILVQKP